MWSNYLGLGAEQILDAPAAVSWDPNRIDVFVKGTDNCLWRKSWDGTGWTGYSQLGTNVIGSTPAACSHFPNRIDVFVKGTDYKLYTKSFS